MRKDFFEEFYGEFAKEMNRLRACRADVGEARTRANRYAQKKLLDVMLDDAVRVQKGKAEMKALEERRLELDAQAQDRRRTAAACTAAWPTSTVVKSRNWRQRSNAKTRAWKRQKSSVDWLKRSS
jgi:hypothetical protein